METESKQSSFIDNVTVNVQSSKCWDFYIQHMEQLKNSMVCIAENTSNSCKVYITEENNSPRIIAEIDDVPVDDVVCYSESELQEILLDFYATYLLGISKQEQEDSLQEFEDVIYNRENELYEAFIQFLDTVTDDSASIYDPEYSEEIQCMMDDVIRYIGVNKKYPVYRPMIIEDGDVRIYTEYPYEEEISEPVEL